MTPNSQTTLCVTERHSASHLPRRFVNNGGRIKKDNVLKLRQKEANIERDIFPDGLCYKPFFYLSPKFQRIS
jgi:hypothetical protein